MTLAEKLRALREKAGMTQETLAESSGVPLWTVRNYEQGRREPNWKGIIQLARALNVSVESFADCVADDAPARPAGPTKRDEPAAKGKGRGTGGKGKKRPG